MNDSRTAEDQRQRLDAFLYSCTRETLYRAISADWLNELIPGLRLLVGCGQGTRKHLEGDAAVHTALVMENLEEVARRRLGREPEFIERLSVMLHDLKKPQTRVSEGDGAVHFPGHEELVLGDVPRVGAALNLTQVEMNRLCFALKHHGVVNNWPSLSTDLQTAIRTSPWRYGLGLLHEADARSCLTGSGHAPVYWYEICADAQG